MRGKLRDKRSEAKRDGFKRDILERRRPAKRDNRNLTWLNQQQEQEEEDYPVEVESAEVVVEKKGK